MGEYAEMMLDGTCCSGCGEFLGSSQGYPIECRSCSQSSGQRAPRRKMGRATKALLLNMAAYGKATELYRETSEIGALFSRGYACRSGKPNHWVLTDKGEAKAAELKAGASHV